MMVNMEKYNCLMKIKHEINEPKTIEIIYPTTPHFITTSKIILLDNLINVEMRLVTTINSILSIALK